MSRVLILTDGMLDVFFGDALTSSACPSNQVGEVNGSADGPHVLPRDVAPSPPEARLGRPSTDT